MTDTGHRYHSGQLDMPEQAGSTGNEGKLARLNNWGLQPAGPRAGSRGRFLPPRCSFAGKSVALILSGICFLAACSGGNRLTGAGPSARNVVLISIDTLRADHLSCYGYGRETSPHIDNLARNGALFLNAYSSSSWTVPSHATMLTGLDPIVHGAVEYPRASPLPEEYLTLAEALRARGLRTAAFTGGAYVSAAFGMAQGFEIFLTWGRRFEDNLPQARKWLAANKDYPFFLFLHGYNVHKPYKPPPPYDRIFARDYSGSYDTNDFQPNNPRPSAEDLRFVISQYDGEIRYVDELLDSLLQYMKELGLLYDTLIIVTSDHGEEFYEHGNVDHIHTLYDELIRVPLIIHGPQIRPAVFHGQVGVIDIMPTILGLLGLKPASPTQGHNLAPFLRNATDTMSHNVYSFTGFSEYPYHLFSIRTPRWKLILWNLAGMKGVSLGHGGKRELYTYKFRKDRQEDFPELFLLSSDKLESRDLAERYPGMRARLSHMLTRRIRSDERLRQHNTTTAPRLNEAEKAALRALGYLQ